MGSPFLMLHFAPLWAAGTEVLILAIWRMPYSRCESNRTLRPDSWISNPRPTQGALFPQERCRARAKPRATSRNACPTFCGGVPPLVFALHGYPPLGPHRLRVLLHSP